tara:strand:+ start:136 stop:402 length:267 start_codon:yes stop_codon:yes gene_type:complete
MVLIVYLATKLPLVAEVAEVVTIFMKTEITEVQEEAELGQVVKEMGLQDKEMTGVGLVGLTQEVAVEQEQQVLREITEVTEEMVVQIV